MVKRVRAVVKATLAGEAEKKLARRGTFGDVPTSTFVGAGQFGLFPCVPAIPQLSSARGRVGDWVHGQDLVVKVTVAWDGEVDDWSERYVRVALLRTAKSPQDLTNGPGGNLLSVDGEVCSNWTPNTTYTATEVSHMPYAEPYKVIGCRDLLMTRTILALGATPGQPEGGTYPGGGAKTVQFRVKNPGKFMYNDTSGQSQSVDAYNGGYYLHIVQYWPRPVIDSPTGGLKYTATSYLSYTDV